MKNLFLFLSIIITFSNASQAQSLQNDTLIIFDFLTYEEEVSINYPRSKVLPKARLLLDSINFIVIEDKPIEMTKDQFLEFVDNGFQWTLSSKPNDYKLFFLALEVDKGMETIPIKSQVPLGAIDIKKIINKGDRVSCLKNNLIVTFNGSSQNLNFVVTIL